MDYFVRFEKYVEPDYGNEKDLRCISLYQYSPAEDGWPESEYLLLRFAGSASKDELRQMLSKYLVALSEGVLKMEEK